MHWPIYNYSLSTKIHKLTHIRNIYQTMITDHMELHSRKSQQTNKQTLKKSPCSTPVINSPSPERITRRQIVVDNITQA